MAENAEIQINRQDEGGEVYLTSLFNGKKHLISANKRFEIGRRSDNNDVDLCIDEEIVSRSHAAIICEEKRYFLIDLDSKNGTYINGKKIVPNQKYLLENYDILEFSRIKYRFEKGTTKKEKLIFGFGSVEFVNIYGKKRVCIEIKKNKEIVHYYYKMVQSNQINGVLNMTIMDSEGYCRLYYDIDKMNTLSSVINQKGYLSKNEFLQTLLDIFEVIKRAQDYLLNPDAFLLVPELVFFAKDENKPALVYLPFDISEKEYTYLKNFVSKLTSSFLEEVDKDFQVRMLKAISSNSFNLKDFKNFILGEQEMPLSERDDLHMEKKSSGENCKKQIRSNDKKKKALLIFQGALILMMGSVLMSSMLRMHQYIGLFIILAAVDIGIIHKYFLKPSQKEEKSQWKKAVSSTKNIE